MLQETLYDVAAGREAIGRFLLQRALQCCAAGSGVQRAAISGSGIFKDSASDAAIRSRFFASEIADWQLTIPDFGIVSGPFQIIALEYGGNHDGEVTFEIALESAGAVNFAEVS